MTSTKRPVIFDDFFEMGLEEAASPFLKPSSRLWAKNLSLRTSFLAAFCLIASFCLSFSPSLLPASHILLTMVYFFAGVPSLIGAVEDLTQLDVNIEVLMTLAAFSSVFLGSGQEGGLLLVLFALSGAIEDAVTYKAKGTLKELHRLNPSTACVVTDSGDIVERSTQDVEKGAKILVKAGEIVPLDSLVISGVSDVNLVHLTGESMPVKKQPGDAVQSGAILFDGALTLEVTHSSGDSTISRIVELITEAGEAKPRMQKWFDRMSRGYALTIIGMSTLFALLLPFVIGGPFLGSDGSVYRALAFLIAASPCALIIAIPIAYLSAISSCAKKGVLLKGGVVLDALAGCKVIAFDKTGTLTSGKLACIGVEGARSESELKDVVGLVASIEQNATHPIARSIVAYAKQLGASLSPVTHFQNIPGTGVEGNVEGYQGRIFIGRVEDPALFRPGEVLAMARVGDAEYLFRFSDALRGGVKEALSRIKSLGRYRLLMLTGDHRENAEKVAREVGFEEVYSALTPEQKLEYVSRLSKEEGLVMVGDGINDAPAIARSSVGISLGRIGSQTAVEAADIVFLQDRVDYLDWVLEKAGKTRAIVRQNLSLAVMAIFAAAIPALMGAIPLWLAVVMHEGGTVLVGLNGLRLLRS